MESHSIRGYFGKRSASLSTPRLQVADCHRGRLTRRRWPQQRYRQGWWTCWPRNARGQGSQRRRWETKWPQPFRWYPEGEIHEHISKQKLVGGEITYLRTSKSIHSGALFCMFLCQISVSTDAQHGDIIQNSFHSHDILTPSCEWSTSPTEINLSPPRFFNHQTSEPVWEII